MLSELILNNIAATVYEAVRAWDSSNNLPDKPSWKKASEDTKQQVIERVKVVLSDPRAGDATFHNKWLAEMKAEGWSEGKEFDEGRKVDPLMVHYHQLPPHIKARERLIRAATISLSHW